MFERRDWPIRKRTPLQVWACVTALVLVASAPFMLRSTGHGLALGRYRLDLDVYRVASHVWLHGAPLYGPLPATSDGTAGLPFSYPPISAVLLSPMAVIPLAVAETLMTIISVALLAVVLRVFLRSLQKAQVTTRWEVKWLLPTALLLEPVRNTLNYGQVNIILMTLVAVDCLYRGPGRTRGALVGVAAAMKLTPAVFILYFLVKKDYRAACVSVISFAACTGIGFLLAWHDSVQYWTSIIFQPSRDGAVGYAANQSLQGVLSRAGLTMNGGAGMAVWLCLALLTVIVAFAGMRRARDAGLDAWVLSLNAFAGLLISPISWSHHWVWAVPAMMALVLIGWRFHDKTVLAVAIAGTAIIAVAPHWLINGMDSNGLTWSPWQQVVGDSYAILAVVLLILSVTLFKWRRPLPEPHEEPLLDLGQPVSDANRS